MKLTSQIAGMFRIRTDQPEVIRAQLRAMSMQMPLAFFLLSTNAMALGATHFGDAPFLLTVATPLFILVASIVRGIDWIRFSRRPFNLADGIRRLRQLRTLSIVLAVLMPAWAIALYRYGDVYQHTHVIFFMSVTVVGVAICLIHFPPAALAVMLIVTAAFALQFGLVGNEIYLVLAINMVLIGFIVVHTISAYARTFNGAVMTRVALKRQNVRTRRLAEGNARLALHDHLTGLANRRGFFRILEDAIGRTRNSTCFAVGLIDLDGFKQANDIYGHAAGDQVLVETGSRLREMVGKRGAVARLGGDEFGILLPLDENSDDLRVRGQKICAALTEPFTLANGAARLSGSLGLSTYPASGLDAETLFDRADYALYFAKAHRTGTAVVFSSEHEALIHRNAEIEQALRTADFDRELSLEFQPIVRGSDGKVNHFEALARWDHPQLGRVAPDRFFPLAEKAGLVSELTVNLFGKALQAARLWPNEIGLSFNLSARDLVTPEVGLLLVAAINRSGIAPSRIAFEITETALLRDIEEAARMIAHLHALGVKVALDDFGTGYSSLSYVHELEFDWVKVDRSFIEHISANERSVKVVKTIVDMCANLGIESIAEGVETRKQAEMLGELGCRYLQGFHFAQPMTALSVAAYLARVQREAKDSGQAVA